MGQSLNEKTVTLKLRRIDVCDLLIATTSLKHSTNAEHWGELHDKLKAILDDFDEKHVKEVK